MGMKPWEERGYRLGKLAKRLANPRSSKVARDSSRLQMRDLLLDYFPDVLALCKEYDDEA